MIIPASQTMSIYLLMTGNDQEEPKGLRQTLGDYFPIGTRQNDANGSRFTSELLRADLRQRLDFHHRWWVPFTGQCIGFRGIETHTEVKRSFGSRKPISFSFRAGTFVFKIQVKRSVRIILEWHPATNGKTVKAVPDLKALLIVEGD